MTTKLALVFIVTLMLAGTTAAQEHVSFPTQDGWIIHGDLYGTGDPQEIHRSLMSRLG